MDIKTLARDDRHATVAKETKSSFVSAKDLVSELSSLISDYLKNRPFITLAAISGRCQVSESTLRRIYNRQVKTLPTPSTVYSILAFVSEEKRIPKLIELYPGLISEYLHENFPHAAEFDCEFSEELNQELKDSFKYLVFKLTCHSSGCTEDQVRDLVGKVGVNKLYDLVGKGFVEKRESRFHSKIMRFSLAPEQFKEKFQFMSQFIKAEESPTQVGHPNVFSNYSSSVNAEAYQKILRIQRQALKKIREAMVKESSKGDMHIFALSAVDTIEVS